MKVISSPIFIASSILFLVHQIMQKGLDIHFTPIDRYLDNLLAMPIILTLLMIERRYLLGRKHDYSLSFLEILIATLVIMLIAEILFPLWSNDFTTDWWDIVFYALGSLIFYHTVNHRGRSA